MNLSHILNHLGEDRASYHYAVSPPIFQTSNFTFADVAHMRASIKDELNNSFYTRGCNPTVAMLRKKVAALEKAEDALIFGSGAAAATAAIISQVEAGNHIVSVAKPYSWTFKLMSIFLKRFGVTTTFIDGTKTENYEKAIQDNTKLLYLESPNSLTFELQDIEAVAKIAKAHKVVTVLDNSYASPINQNPIEMGIDIVFHSATKYLGGHSDTVCGVLCANEAIIRQIFANEYMTFGGIISPNDAAMLLRSLRTLPLRMERIGQTTLKIVEFLENHPKIEQVYFPHSPSFPQYELAQKQHKAPSGLFSIKLKAKNRDDIDRFCDSLQAFLLACSWGGHESLVFPICGLDDSENYKENELAWNLIRVNIGLEDADFLIEDLKQALEKI